MEMKWLTDFYKSKVKYPLNQTEDDTRCVYVIYSGSSGLFKIGISNNYNQRLMQIRAQSGMKIYEVIIIWLEPGRDEPAKIIETTLHEFFKSKRIVGEWFSLSIKDLIQIKNLFWEVIEGDYIEDNIKDILETTNAVKEHNLLMSIQ